MEPQIRYVRSADGTRIATASLGRRIDNWIRNRHILSPPAALQHGDYVRHTRGRGASLLSGAGLFPYKTSDGSLMLRPYFASKASIAANTSSSSVLSRAGAPCRGGIS